MLVDINQVISSTQHTRDKIRSLSRVVSGIDELCSRHLLTALGASGKWVTLIPSDRT